LFSHRFPIREAYLANMPQPVPKRETKGTTFLTILRTFPQLTHHFFQGQRNGFSTAG
jgi:hypothetical protein